MPIPDAVAGYQPQPPSDVDRLAPAVFDLANKALRQEITADEWEKTILRLCGK